MATLNTYTSKLTLDSSDFRKNLKKAGGDASSFKNKFKSQIWQINKTSSASSGKFLQGFKGAFKTIGAGALGFFNGFKNSLRSLSSPLSGIAASLAGVFGAKEVFSYVKNIENLKELYGLTEAQAKGLSVAAFGVNASVSDLGGAIETIAGKIQDLKMGELGDITVLSAFNKLGISAYNAKGEVISLYDFILKLRRIPKQLGARQAQVIFQKLGLNSNISRLFNLPEKQFRKFIDISKNINIGDKTLKSFDDFNLLLAKTKVSLLSIGIDALNFIKPALTFFSNILEKYPKTIGIAAAAIIGLKIALTGLRLVFTKFTGISLIFSGLFLVIQDLYYFINGKKSAFASFWQGFADFFKGVENFYSRIQAENMRQIALAQFANEENLDKEDLASRRLFGSRSKDAPDPFSLANTVPQPSNTGNSNVFNINVNVANSSSNPNVLGREIADKVGQEMNKQLSVLR